MHTHLWRLSAAPLWVALALSSAPAHAQDVLGETGVRGAGSTFVYPVLSSWSHEYRVWRSGHGPFAAPNSGLEDPLPTSALEYEPVGSLAGMLRVKDRAVDFAASEMPLSSDELTAFGLGQFPVAIGGIVAAIHIDGVGASDLYLNGPVLAQIYLGAIKRWSDPAIKRLNPSLALPDAAISVMHRSDGSGTTFNFTSYLSRLSPEWKLRAGAGLLVSWPTGTGAKGNEGVAKAVKATRNSIGYVEYAQASKSGLRYALLQNRAGRFVKPGVASFQAAAAGADWQSSKDFNVMLIDAAPNDAYPMTVAVFAFVHKRAPRAKTAAVVDFFRWSLTHGSTSATRLGYVPVPPVLVQHVSDYWATTFGIRADAVLALGM